MSASSPLMSLSPQELWDIVKSETRMFCGAVPKSPDESIAEFFRKHTDDGCDLYLFYSLVGSRVELKGPRKNIVDRLNEYFGSHPHPAFEESITFADLLRYLDAHTIRFDPVEIGGRPCAKAGIFLGLREMVLNRAGQIGSFGPSTPIRQVLRGASLRAFWLRLIWYTDGRLEPLPKPWYFQFQLLWIAIISVPCFWLTFRGSVWWIASVLMLEWLSRWWVAERIDRLCNPLPPDIVTFHDLTERLEPTE